MYICVIVSKMTFGEGKQKKYAPDNWERIRSRLAAGADDGT